MTELSDEEIVQRIQRGDKELFGTIMDRYERKLSRYGRKFLSGEENIVDMVQEVFIKTYESIQGFDTSKRFSPWIYRIAHNTFINALKKNIRNPLYLIDFDTLISHPIYEDGKVDEEERAEIMKFISSGLEKLRPAEREILLLYFMEEMSYKEIADILRVPIGTVGVRLKRAKASLKKIYQTSNQYE